MVRIYGKHPYKAAVLHGGPGAPGYMAPVARKLSESVGVLEPIQSAQSLQGQIEELHTQLREHTSEPLVLIGSSWGATLALLYAAQFSDLVQKIVLIGSCVYDAGSSEKIKELRSSRMSEENTLISAELSKRIANADESEKNLLFAKLADCSFESDTFDPITADLETLECEYETNQLVWSEFKNIRDNTDELKSIFSKIKIPVVNIHGDYDPHILEGIQPFLESTIGNVGLHVLEKCGHYPWIERHARDLFFDHLLTEILTP